MNTNIKEAIKRENFYVDTEQGLHTWKDAIGIMNSKKLSVLGEEKAPR
jgi:hypothetical protein